MMIHGIQLPREWMKEIQAGVGAPMIYPKTLLHWPVEGAAPSAPPGHLAATARRPPIVYWNA
jgi:hypothetical protein